MKRGCGLAWLRRLQIKSNPANLQCGFHKPFAVNKIAGLHFNWIRKMEKLDGKFYGQIFKEKNGEEVPADSFIVFLAKDRALLPTLEFYRSECERIGCDLPQLIAINDLLCRVQRWQSDHPELMKLPDVESGEIFRQSKEAK